MISSERSDVVWTEDFKREGAVLEMLCSRPLAVRSDTVSFSGGGVIAIGDMTSTVNCGQGKRNATLRMGLR